MRRLVIIWGIVGIVALRSGTANAELPQCFDVPSVNDDYRIGYDLTTGIWDVSLISLHHRLHIQLPLWGAAAGAQFTVANTTGEVSDSAAGNLRMYFQYFHSFQWARRANFWLGGGLDGYLPTATSLEPQAPEAHILAGVAAGDSSIIATDTSFALRPRIHLAAEAWIFSAQIFGSAAIQFVDGSTRSAFEWGVNFSAQATDWLVLVAEATGVSWMVGSPEWMGIRFVTLGGGLRFLLPSGFMLGLWSRGSALGAEPNVGEGAFIGVNISWRHARNWILF